MVHVASCLGFTNPTYAFYQRNECACLLQLLLTSTDSGLRLSKGTDAKMSRFWEDCASKAAPTMSAGAVIEEPQQQPRQVSMCTHTL